MRKHLIGAALAVTFLGAAAQAETRNLSGFSAIDVEGIYKTEIAIGETYSVSVEGPEASRVETYVRGEELFVRTRNRPLFGSEPRVNATVRITTPRLSSLEVSRGADVEAHGLNASALDLSAAMGGTMDVNGRCENLEIAASMGGSIRASSLVCGDVHASASMGGAIDVQALDAIEASASMGGSINVSGGPEQRSRRASMGGAININ